MSDWGEDDYGPGVEAQPVDVDDDSLRLRARAFGIDIGSLAGELVDQAVKGAVRRQVADVAAEAVDEALTDDLVAALRARAADAAAAAITEQVEATAADDAGAAVDDAAPDDEPALYFGSVDEFVREYLRNVYRRRIDGRHRCWAGRWWLYDEAVIRLEALWRSWEHLRQDAATGMSVWWRDHADHHMPTLMDPNGPFALAIDGEENTCKQGDPLPYVPPPKGMFPDVRTTAQGAPA